MDLSPLRKWEILGPDAEALVQRAITRDARRLSVGQVTYTAVCNETGGMMDDATVYRLGQDNFRFVGGDEYDGIWLKELADRHELKVWVKPSTDQLHNLAVQGPESREILKKIIWTPPTQTSLEDLKWFRFTVGRIRTYDGIPIVVSRTGYTGELGYEIYCKEATRNGMRLWDTVLEAGEPHGLAVIGPSHIRRIEGGILAYGADMELDTNPYEVDMGYEWMVDLEQEADFIGKDALKRIKTEGLSRKLVGVEIGGPGLGSYNDGAMIDYYPVSKDGKEVGQVTSSCYSPRLEKNIGYAMLPIELTEFGTELEVEAATGRQSAVVVRKPFIDPKKDTPKQEVALGAAAEASNVG